MNRLDLIIFALERASHVPKGVVYPAGYPMQIAQALAAARELRELKPVAWVYINEDGECEQIEYGSEGCDDPAVQPLYALDDEVKHD